MTHEWVPRAASGFPTSIGERKTEFRAYTCLKCDSTVEAHKNTPPDPGYRVGISPGGRLDIGDGYTCEEVIAAKVMGS
jgi:hypothetical protein